MKKRREENAFAKNKEIKRDEINAGVLHIYQRLFLCFICAFDANLAFREAAGFVLLREMFVLNIHIISEELAFDYHEFVLTGLIFTTVLLGVILLFALIGYAYLEKGMKTKNKIDAWFGMVSFSILFVMFVFALVNEYRKGPDMYYVAEVEGVGEILDVDIEYIKEEFEKEGFEFLQRDKNLFLLTDKK